jgi:hypothetical protein
MSETFDSISDGISLYSDAYVDKNNVIFFATERRFHFFDPIGTPQVENLRLVESRCVKVITDLTLENRKRSLEKIVQDLSAVMRLARRFESYAVPRLREFSGQIKQQEPSFFFREEKQENIKAIDAFIVNIKLLFENFRETIIADVRECENSAFETFCQKFHPLDAKESPKLPDELWGIIFEKIDSYTHPFFGEFNKELTFCLVSKKMQVIALNGAIQQINSGKEFTPSFDFSLYLSASSQEIRELHFSRFRVFKNRKPENELITLNFSQNLEKLEIPVSNCNLSSISQLINLKSLSVIPKEGGAFDFCWTPKGGAVFDLSWLSNLQRLRELMICSNIIFADCTHLTNLQTLAIITNASVDLSKYFNIESVYSLSLMQKKITLSYSMFTNLQGLCIAGCSDVLTLSQLSSLKSLAITGFNGGKIDLSSSKCLESVYIKGCHQPVEFKGVEQLKNLKSCCFTDVKIDEGVTVMLSDKKMIEKGFYENCLFIKNLSIIVEILGNIQFLDQLAI